MTSTSASDSASRLAEVFLDCCFAMPLESLLSPNLVARLIREALRAELASSRADEVTKAVLALATRYFSELGNRRIGDALPKEMTALLREVIARPYTPDKQLIVALLSREPFSRLNRELMVGTLLDYSRRLRTTVTEGGMGRGLGALSRLASEAVKKSTSALGTIAPGVTSAVSDEVERQMQRRAAEFADGAVVEMVQRVAGLMTDPERAALHRELKLEMLDFALGLRGSEVARELCRLELPELLKKLHKTALTWLDRDEAPAEIEKALTWLFLQRELLSFWPPAPNVRAAIKALLENALRPAIESGAFLRALSGQS